MSRLSNWREEFHLLEVVTGKMTDTEALKKVSEKKGIKNKVVINPKLSEAIEDIGGEVLEVNEALAPTKQELNIMKKINLLQLRLQKEKKKTVNAADKVAKQDDEVVEEVGVASSTAAMAKAKKEAELKAKEEAAVKKQKDATKKEEFEAAVEYFYAEGINEEGIDLIIEEVGLDDFIDFVDDSAELLTEERAARKMNIRTLKSTQKKAEEIKASKKDVVKKAGPKDILSRARSERTFKKPKLAKPTPKAKKDFDGDGKKETPKQEHRGVRNKKITQAVKKVKPAQPKKPASKEGIRAKVKAVYDAGVKRHRKATQPIRVFHKGMKKAPKAVAKAAVDVKRAIAPRKEEFSNWRGDLVEKDLTAAERRALPNKDFALPGKGEGPKGKQAGSYPIPDEKHARSALSLVSQHGTPEEKATVRAKVKKKFPNIDVSEAKVDTGSAAEKATARNKRNTPPGKDSKFDTSVFITRKPGESLDSARTRKRREAHSKKRGMKEDRALDIVRANIIKKHGEGSIYDPKNPPKAQPKPKAKPDTRTPEQKKRDQEKANIDAVYGRTPWNKKGSLGT